MTTYDEPGAVFAVSADFVFGTLATDELRLAQLRAAAAGVHHGHDLRPLDPEPGEPIEVRVTLGPAVDADHVTAYFTVDGEDPAGSHGVAETGVAVELARTGVTWDTLAWAYRETWAGTIPGQPDGTLVRYRIEARTARSPESAWASEIAGVTTGHRPADVTDEDARLFAFAGELWPVRRRASYAVHVDRERVPEWLRDAVLYEVFVDRFATTGGAPFATPATPGGFFGGTIRGVLERLDHIADLGATCIWLTPVFPSPSHHGYDTTDYLGIEPRLGNEDDLRALVEAVHARGMRIVLDLVANHASSEHPAFRTALAHREAPEARWFTFTDWPAHYLSFFGVRDHPQLDTDDPGARDHLIAAGRKWLTIGVDGFRCDYANGPSPAFWSQFRAATRAASPDSALLGEIVETPALWRTYRGRLDGSLDFILLQALRGAFAFGTVAPSQLDAFLRRHLVFAEGDWVQPSFLDNHDMNRFLWVVGGDTRRLRLAALCQFTLPQPPIVYYGTEVGLSQTRDVRYADGSGHPEESRRPMPWGDAQDRELLAFYRELVALRRAEPARWRAERVTLTTDDDAGLYAYRVADATVVLNLSATARRWTRPRGAGQPALTTDPGVDVRGHDIGLPPYAGALFLTR